MVSAVRVAGYELRADGLIVRSDGCRCRQSMDQWGRPGRGGFGVDVVSVAERRPPCGCVLSPPRIAGTRAIGVRGSTDGTTESARAVALWGRMAPRVGQHFVRTPS